MESRDSRSDSEGHMTEKRLRSSTGGCLKDDENEEDVKQKCLGRFETINRGANYQD